MFTRLTVCAYQLWLTAVPTLTSLYRLHVSKDCLRWHHVKILFWVVISSEMNWWIVIETLSCNHQFFLELKSMFHMVSLQTVFTYRFHHTKLQILLRLHVARGVTIHRCIDYCDTKITRYASWYWLFFGFTQNFINIYLQYYHFIPDI